MNPPAKLSASVSIEFATKKAADRYSGFIPKEGDWIHVEVTLWHIRISVYHKNGTKDAKYWLNGEWFNTPFPEKYPNL